MKKKGVFIFLAVLFLMPLISSANETNAEKIENGFKCLVSKVGDCSAMTNQEIALTILATPEGKTFDDCVKELEKRKSSDNWGNVRDTALAVLALSHAGKNTNASEKWLLEKSKTPVNLIWYLQQDSDGQTQCRIGYDATDHIINIGENKKIDKDAGNCLKRAQSNFWLQVSNECYGKEFVLECDKNFIGSLLYKNKDSPTIYVLEGTKSASAYGKITMKINSKCFGDTTCDYEATAWTTLALLKKGHNVEEYIPYLIAMSETNKRYLPDAFIYIITNYEGYATKLASSQKLGNYWEADNSAYNRHYDTSLALLALGSSTSEQIQNAKSWVFFSQGNDGCWQNSIRETAIVLWALAGRSGRTSNGTKITYCSEAKFFCIPSTNCPETDNLGNNYFCPIQSDTCCRTENLQTCSAYDGSVCKATEVCTGNERKATDTDRCCTGECVERPTETECKKMGYVCRDSCLDTQEKIDFACDYGQVCCRTKTTSDEPGSKWIWILIILIAIVLIAILYIYREKLKLLLFKMKIRFRKDRGGPASRGPSFPPRGPPARQNFPTTRETSAQRFRPEERETSDVFSRLREMSSK